MFFKRVLLALKGMVAGEEAAEVCGRNGLQSFLEELAAAGARLQRLFAHNVKVGAFCSPLKIVANSHVQPWATVGMGDVECVQHHRATL